MPFEVNLLLKSARPNEAVSTDEFYLCDKLQSVPESIRDCFMIYLISLQFPNMIQHNLDPISKYAKNKP
jgi:hypothetical protein